MNAETLAGVLEREHHEIDRAIEGFLLLRRHGHSSSGLLAPAIAALRRHIYLEEALLFPPLRDGGLFAPILVMLREHGEIWRTLDALEQDLAADTPGCAADDLIEQLVAQLERHNTREEVIVYPLADCGLSDTARDQLSAFAATGVLPDGWTCAQATTHRESRWGVG